VAHRDRSLLDFALKVSAEYPPDPDSPTGAAAILRDGHTEYLPDITPEQVDAAARDDRHRQLLRRLSLRSALSVPLIAGGRITGVLSLVHGESGRRFETYELTCAEHVRGWRAGSV